MHMSEEGSRPIVRMQGKAHLAAGQQVQACSGRLPELARALREHQSQLLQAPDSAAAAAAVTQTVPVADLIQPQLDCHADPQGTSYPSKRLQQDLSNQACDTSPLQGPKWSPTQNTLCARAPSA